MSAWFYHRAGTETGPIDDRELRRLAATGIVRPHTRVKKGLDGTWVTAEHVKGLFPAQAEPTQSPSSRSTAESTTSAPAGSHDVSTPPARSAPPPLPATRPTASVPSDIVASQTSPRSPAATPTVAEPQWFVIKEGFLDDEIVGPLPEVTFLDEIYEARISPKMKVMSPTRTKNGWCHLKQLPMCMKVWEKGAAERERRKEEETEEKRRQRELRTQEKSEQDRLQAEAQAQTLAQSFQVEDLNPQNGEITVGQLLSYITKLPDRPWYQTTWVTRRYPDGSNEIDPLKRFRRQLRKLDPAAIVYGPNSLSILQRARLVDNGLSLEYGCLFTHLGLQIMRGESLVTNDPDAKALVYAFREIEAHAEMGIDRQNFCRLVAQISLRLKDFVAVKSAQYPLFSALLNGIFLRHRDVVSIWHQGAGAMNVQFVGGGFGLQGAATGMAIGLGLNALVDAANRRKQSDLNDQICAQWALASRLLRVAEWVMRSASTYIPMAELVSADSGGAGHA